MATTLYVISIAPSAGKSAVCAGLGLRFREDGHAVGYLKPVSVQGKDFADTLADEDAQFMRRVLDLQEPLEDLSPVVLDPERKTVQDEDPPGVIRAAHDRVSRSKKVVIAEGAPRMHKGAALGLSAYDVGKLLQPRVLLVVRYTGPQSLEALSEVQEIFGDALVGVVFNAVPQDEVAQLRDELAPQVRRRGIPVLGTVPWDPSLSYISVAEAAEVLGGEILNDSEQGNELVENLMLGAEGLDKALDYFHRKPNKLVFAHGNRPDVQLTALQTSTRCLVLTGGIPPNVVVRAQAEDRGVPLILVQEDTLTAVERLEHFLATNRFHQERKITRFRQLLKQHFDFAALYERLAL